MTKRIQKLAMAVAALAALALGGAVFAQAQSSPSAAPERTSAPDRDNVQSGNQTTPDAPTAKGARHVRHHAAESPETGAESESAPANDGPGGHADEPGNANADHQFQGNE
jgi:hypothetical protein